VCKDFNITSSFKRNNGRHFFSNVLRMCKETRGKAIHMQYGALFNLEAYCMCKTIFLRVPIYECFATCFKKRNEILQLFIHSFSVS
jgi:hypothetical protein